MSERRLKIAFVVDRFGARYGGAEAYGVALMRELAQDHEVTVLAREYDCASGLRLPFIPLRFSRRWPSWMRVLLFAIRARRLTRRGYDIVHSHMNGWCGDVEVVHVTPVRYNWRVRPLPALKRLLAPLSPRVRTYLWLEARRVAPRPAHRTVAVSTLIADQLHQAYGSGLELAVVPPGVAPPGPRDSQRRARTRAAFGWSDADRVCLLVARNALRKGLPTLLEALSRLPPAYKLLIVGSGAASTEFVRRWNGGALTGRVRAVGDTADVEPYYECADFYVHPTLNDSFGMAPLEAMSFGLPVILSATPWCGFAAYVTHGQEALILSNPRDGAELAAHIRALGDDAALRIHLAAGAAELVGRHSWSGIADRYRALYAEILGERARSDPAA